MPAQWHIWMHRIPGTPGQGLELLVLFRIDLTGTARWFCLGYESSICEACKSQLGKMT